MYRYAVYHELKQIMYNKKNHCSQDLKYIGIVKHNDGRDKFSG